MVSAPPGGSRLAGRVYRNWLLTLLALALCTAFIALGHWQWQRGQARQLEWDAFVRGADQALPLGSREFGELPRFQRVSAMGRFDSAHQFLLDNRSHAGQPGYEVLTPFERMTGGVLLVNRGWLPFTGFRDRLPQVAFAGDKVREIVGRVDELPAAGLASGRAAPPVNGAWPRLTSFPRPEELSAALGRHVEARILLLDPRAPDGYLRDWQPPGLSPSRHWSYAIQWWSFALATLAIWIVLNWRRGRSTA